MQWTPTQLGQASDEDNDDDNDDDDSSVESELTWTRPSFHTLIPNPALHVEGKDK